MSEQRVTELGIVKDEGIAVKPEHLENIHEQSVTELGIVKVEGIAVIFEQSANMFEQLVTESDICIISIVFRDALKFEWLPVILIVYISEVEYECVTCVDLLLPVKV